MSPDDFVYQVIDTGANKSTLSYGMNGVKLDGKQSVTPPGDTTLTNQECPHYFTRAAIKGNKQAGMRYQEQLYRYGEKHHLIRPQ